MKYIAPRKYFWGILLWFAFNSSYMAQDLPVLLSSKSEETETGLRIEFQFSSHIERADVSSWIEQKNWFILNFYNIIRPEPDFFQNISSYPIQDIQQSWSQNALQLSIQISRSIGMFDVIIDDKNNLVIITLTFKDEIDCSRGHVISSANSPLESSDQFETIIIWMHEDALVPGRSYHLKIGSLEVQASCSQPKYKINILAVCFSTSELLKDKKFVNDFFKLSS